MIEGQNNSCVNHLTGQLATWEKRQGQNIHCSYCGSITPDEALILLVTRGVHYSGCDWKYGWPHKFYLSNVKFYSGHLVDATEDQVVLWNRITEGNLEIKFWLRKDNKLIYASPLRGYQSCGVIGGVRDLGNVSPGWFDENIFVEGI